MSCPLVFAFWRPLNDVALDLNDYHNIIAKPIDLGTIHAFCTMGHYSVIDEILEDFDLYFKNTMHYNPPNNIVYQAIIKLGDFFCSEIGRLIQQLGFSGGYESDYYGRVCMILDFFVFLKERISTKDNKTTASYVKKMSSEMNFQDSANQWSACWSLATFISILRSGSAILQAEIQQKGNKHTT